MRHGVVHSPHDSLASEMHSQQNVQSVNKREKGKTLVEPVEMVNVLLEFLALFLLGQVQKARTLETALLFKQACQVREKMIRRVLASGVKTDFYVFHRSTYANINLFRGVRP